MGLRGDASRLLSRHHLAPCFCLRPGSCDTDGDAAILSLSVETPLSPPGQRHVGVVSTNLQWVLKHLVAEPAVERRKGVLGETGNRLNTLTQFRTTPKKTNVLAFKNSLPSP